MSQRSLAAKVMAVVWALLIGAALVLLAGSLVLPSTKRARVDWDELRRQPAESDAAAPAPGTMPVTGTVASPDVPATRPTPAAP